jgi:hypothetical protein
MVKEKAECTDRLIGWEEYCFDRAFIQVALGQRTLEGSPEGRKRALSLSYECGAKRVPGREDSKSKGPEATAAWCAH